jgi:ribosomal subunit interface protein
MRIQIASKTVEITKALRSFTREQAAKLDKVNQKISRIQIFLDKQVKGSKRENNALVKYVVSVPGKTIVIRRAADDMYKAIGLATDRVIRHVRKLKERRNGHSKRFVRVATH